MMENQELGYKVRKRINITQNSRGVSVETTCEMVDVSNEEAVNEAKDLFERAKKAVND